MFLCGKRFRRIFIFFMIYSPIAAPWQNITNGIEYCNLGESFLRHIHVFRVDLQKFNLELISARSINKDKAYAYEFLDRAVLAINGGFFDKKAHPLGLRISNKQTLSRLKKISWWGVLYLKDNRLFLKNFNDFSKVKNVTFAIQAGPRLIINGRIPKLKPGLAQRSALGITRDNKLIILATQHFPLSTNELAEIMKNPPILALEALNLDGGNSTQLAINLPEFKLDILGFSAVSDIITLTEKL